MEEPIPLSQLNDFIFCPISIYYHNLFGDTDKMAYQSTVQINGTHIHKTVDNGGYSDRKNILQGISVYSEQYNLYGKIDLFDVDRGILTEWKKKIKIIYEGFIFQMYGQYFGLTEAGYTVKKLRLYSYDDNRNYGIALPQEDLNMVDKFNKLIKDIRDFSPDTFVQRNPGKCAACIYEPLCDRPCVGG